MSEFMPDAYLQIDVKHVYEKDNIVECNMYTGRNCVKIYMHPLDYQSLLRDGFFIRDGKEKDFANVLNTTDCYYLQKEHA